VHLKFRFGYDDSLDVIGVHLVGGILGSLLVGLFADRAVNAAGRDGVFAGGGWSLMGEQVIAVAATVVFSLAVTALIALVLRAVMPGGIRVSEEEEETGLDLAEHSETAYAFDRA
jgi:Amt family ammonium transporter